MNLDEFKHILLIGGRSGIGRSYLDLVLARHDSLVTYCGRSEIVPSLSHDRLNFAKLDLSVAQKRRSVVEDAVAKFGKIDHIVFFQRNRSTSDELPDEVDIMLSATSDIIESAIDVFKPSGSRSIVVLNSALSRFATSETPLAYHLVRGALEQLVRYFAVRLGPDNIRVNSVSTCTIQKIENTEFFGGIGKKRADYQRGITPRGYFGTSEDISHIISFLASDVSNLINGQTIVADGGMTLQWPEDFILKAK